MNTRRPMPSPSGMVMPGAVNFNGASISEMPMTSPSHTAGTTISRARAPSGPPAGAASAQRVVRRAESWGPASGRSMF